MGVFQRAGEGIAGQTEGQAIRFGNRFFDAIKAADGCDRTKRFVIEHLCFQRHIGQHGRGKEVAAVTDAIAASGNGGTLAQGIGHELGHGGEAPAVGQRSHADALFQAITHFQAFGLFHHGGDEVLAQAAMHQKARGRNAHLASVAEFCGTGRLGCQFDIGILGHDHRGMTTQLHGDALHMLSGHGRQLLAHRGRSGEGDLADDRVRNQIAGDLGRIAIDQADHAGRHTGIDKGAQQLGR